ncbi:hypothetical protein [Fodinibius saliphilus]|uniref:hypothetical protein n=1 Tax=Fodinibius saliphilus TaxID=1920650 RepID=UPI001108EAD1|nr:hypothetical protein [Fodinibius saliphilus]
MDKEKKESQIEKIKRVLEVRPRTTKMIQKATGIPRENITRHIAKLEKRNQVVTVDRRPCQITGYVAKYYSTDPELFPPEKQSELFPGESQSKVYDQ